MDDRIYVNDDKPAFHWAKGLGFGVLIWLIMFAFISALVGIQMQNTLWAQLLTALVTGAASYFCARAVKVSTVSHALGYGLLWAAVGIVLDILISARFASGMFGMWQYWLGYFLVFFAPWLRVETHHDLTTTYTH